MKNLYSFSKRKGMLSFLLISLISIESFSQATTCSSVPAACVGTTETFTGSANGFTGTAGGFTYSNDAFIVANTNPNTSYPILSRVFTLSANTVINIGFTTAGSTANLNTYTVEILRASDNLVLASCLTDPAPAAGPICYTITDADIVSNLDVRYRITIRTAGGNNQSLVFDDFTYLQIQQAPLPVGFTSFTATRNDTRVLLKWQTATESNNRLFEVQRKTSKNDFEVISSIPSKAQNGNSSAILNYEFEDVNNFKGSSHYRLRQVDLDGKSTYSVIRIVGNKTGEKILVYPNPSRNGAVSVTFNSNEARHIDLVDNTGRVVKQWKVYTDQDLKIDKLSIGVYLLKTKNLQTSEQDIQRIVVTK